MSHHAEKLKLLGRLRELGGRLDDIEDALESEHSRDWEEQAVEREGEEVLERLGEAGQAEVARIRAALQRMADGSYGVCVRCGGQIVPARLMALPETALCADCASGG